MMLEEPAYAYDDASERLASPDATALEPATAASFAKLERPSPQPQRHLLDVTALQHLLPGQPLFQTRFLCPQLLQLRIGVALSLLLPFQLLF